MASEIFTQDAKMITGAAEFGGHEGMQCKAMMRSCPGAYLGDLWPPAHLAQLAYPPFEN